MTLEANKALIRRIFEEVIPAGDVAAMRDLVAPDWLDHDPLPGQPAGPEGPEYVVSTMHGAHPDLRFTIDDLVAEDDRVVDPLDAARHQHRPDARPAAHRSAGRAGGHRDLPHRGRQDRGALGGWKPGFAPAAPVGSSAWPPLVIWIPASTATGRRRSTSVASMPRTLCWCSPTGGSSLPATARPRVFFCVARLRANGAFDTTFGSGGRRTIDFGGDSGSCSARRCSRTAGSCSRDALIYRSPSRA